MLLVFLFIKRQIIRFTLKNRRGPHYQIGLNAPKFLKREIERRLLLTNEIKTEPLLLNGENQFHEFQSTDEGIINKLFTINNIIIQLFSLFKVPTEHYYRMKTIDELKKLEELIVNISGDEVKRKANHDLRDYLVSLTKENKILNKCDLKILNQFVDLYLHARHEPVFGKKHFNVYMNLIQKIQKFIVKKYSMQTNSKSSSQVIFDRKLLNQTQMIGKSVLGGYENENSKETCV